RAHLDDPKETAYCIAVVAGTAALLAGAVGRDPLFSLHDCAIAAGAFVCTCVVTLGVLLIEGVAPASIVTSLVVRQIQLNVIQGNWYVSVGLSRWRIVWAIVGPATALFVARRRRRCTLTRLRVARHRLRMFCSSWWRAFAWPVP